MIEVSLLGRVSVAVDGAPLTGEAAQRRRLALLALLSVPTPHPLSRDRAMLFLWPDHDTFSARRLLAQAAFVLRKALGHEALVTTSDEISLAAEAVRVDVVAFEEALRRGEHEEALRLYHGPFMDGFHAGAGPEMEQWIDGERTRLERSYAQALEGAASARRAAGDLAGAVEAWRKRVMIDPYSGHGALGLMRALAEAGDRAGAIRHAGVHRQLLDSELGAAPDAEVEALAEQLRAEATASAAAPVLVPVGAAAGGVVVEHTAAAQAAAPTPEPPQPGQPTVPPLEPAASRERPPAPAVTASLGRRLARRWREGALALLLVALTIFVWERWRTKAREPTPLTLAVLPCDNPSGKSGTEDVGALLADEIRDALANVGELQIVARTSSMAMRGKNLTIPEIGSKLGASYVVECSVRISADRVELTAAITAVADGMRKWDDKWEGQSAEFLAIREKMARGVAKVLRVRMAAGALAGGTDSLAAYRYYSAAQKAWYERTPESLARAAQYYDSALAVDPRYAQAWAGLALTLIVQGSYDYGSIPPDSAFDMARRAAKRAQALVPDLGQAHLALAGVYMNYDWRLADAEREFQRAIEDDQGNSTAHQWYALLLIAQKRFDEGRTEMLRSGERESPSAAQHVQLAHYFYYKHQYDLTLQEARSALEIDPAFPRAYLIMALAQIQSGRADSAAAIVERLRTRAQEPAVVGVLAYAYARAGQAGEARKWRAWLERTRRQRYVPAELLALVNVGLGEKSQALDELERAYDQHSNGMIYLSVEPAMEPLSAEPRFKKLVQDVAAGRRPTPRPFLKQVRALP